MSRAFQCSSMHLARRTDAIDRVQLIGLLACKMLPPPRTVQAVQGEDGR